LKIKKKAVKKSTQPKTKKCMSSPCSPSGAVYGLGFIGAVIYFFSTATGFWVGVLGLLKALVWPAILVYELFKFLVL
jgi:hypothetical protein